MEPKGVFPEERKIPGEITESVIFRVFLNFAEDVQKVTDPGENYRKITGQI